MIIKSTNSYTSPKAWESLCLSERIEEKMVNVAKTAEFRLVMTEILRLQGGRILDAGCGTGRWSFYLHSKGYMVYSVDFMPQILKRAKRNLTLSCFSFGV